MAPFLVCSEPIVSIANEGSHPALRGILVLVVISPKAEDEWTCASFITWMDHIRATTVNSWDFEFPQTPTFGFPNLIYIHSIQP